MFISMPLAILSIESEADREFMAKLYIEKRELMYRIAHYYSGSFQDAEDAVSESCLGLIRKIDKLKTFEDSELEAYIVATVKNAVRMIYRKKSSNAEQTLSTELDIVDPDSDTEEIILTKWSVEELSIGIRKLSPDDQSLIMMRFFRDIPIKRWLGCCVSGKKQYAHVCSAQRRDYKKYWRMRTMPERIKTPEQKFEDAKLAYAIYQTLMQDNEEALHA